MEKIVWSSEDLEQIDFHDCRIYAILFPDESLQLHMDIDCVFESILDEKNNTYKFLVAPCYLTFENVLNLKLAIDFENSINIDILSLMRTKKKQLGDTAIYSYVIETDKGDIGFISTGHFMRVNKPPILTEMQALGRANAFNQ